MEVKVRYRRAISVTLLVSSVFVLLDSVVVGLKHEFPFSLLSGLVTLLAGYFLFTKTYFKVSKHELVLYKPTGSVQETYSLRSLKDLTIEEHQIFYIKKDKREKLPIYRWLSNENDWNTLLETLPNVPASVEGEEEAV